MELRGCCRSRSRRMLCQAERTTALVCIDLVTKEPIRLEVWGKAGPEEARILLSTSERQAPGRQLQVSCSGSLDNPEAAKGWSGHHDRVQVSHLTLHIIRSVMIVRRARVRTQAPAMNSISGSDAGNRLTMRQSTCSCLQWMIR